MQQNQNEHFSKPPGRFLAKTVHQKAKPTISKIDTMAIRFCIRLRLKLKMFIKQSKRNYNIGDKQRSKASFNVPMPGRPTTSSYKPMVCKLVSVVFTSTVKTGKKSISPKAMVAKKSQMVCTRCIMLIFKAAQI